MDKVLNYTHSLLQKRISFSPDILIDLKYILFELFLERIVYHADDKLRLLFIIQNKTRGALLYTIS